jgi:hypothetical protein
MQKLLDWGLPLVFAAGIGCVVLANPEPLARDQLCELMSFCFYSPNAAFWNNISYELGLAASVSIFFYWLLVKAPEKSRKSRFRRHLVASYRLFREAATFQFLSASGELSIRYDLVSQLTTTAAFRDYFKQASCKIHGDKWHEVANGLEAHHRRELLRIMSMLRDDVLYVLNNTDVDDDKSFDFLHRLTRAIASHDPRVDDYDEDKSLLRFFWGVMAGWNPISGYEQEDPIERLINRI